MCLGDCGITRRQVLIGGASALAVACGPGSTASAPAPTPGAPGADGALHGPVGGVDVSFASGAKRVAGRLFRPQPDRLLPAVLVSHGNPGFLPYLEGFCGRVAARGYVVLFVDCFGGGPPFPKAEAEQAAWRKAAGSRATWRDFASQLDAGLRWLRSERLASADVAAAVGFCGGGIVLAHYAAQGAPLRSLILFYTNARLSHDLRNPDDPLPDLLDLTDRIKVPIQAHCGAHDPTARLDESREFERRLAATGARPEFFYYADAGHGFMQTGEPLAADGTWGFVPAAAAEAEARVLENLKTRLR